MLCTLTEDRLGNVIVSPVNRHVRETIIADQLKNGAPAHHATGEVFMQQPSAEDVADMFGKSALFRGEVNDGARIRVDDWTFRQYCGYAAG